jgi:hypothetical protein
MRFSRSLLAVLLGSVIAVIGLAPRVADAAPCCSSPFCQRDPPPSICGHCLECVGDSDDGIDYEHEFDDAAGVCLPVGG